MIIGVAGAYSSPDEAQIRSNLDALNEAAVRLLERGHIPVIGVNAALPVVEKLSKGDRYKAIMDISLTVINCCEALLPISESPGANRERDLVLSKGLPVYYAISEIPDPA